LPRSRPKRVGRVRVRGRGSGRRGRPPRRVFMSSGEWLVLMVVAILCFFIGYRWARGSGFTAGLAMSVAPMELNPTSFYVALSTFSMLVGIIAGIIGTYISYQILKLWRGMSRPATTTTTTTISSPNK
jgi:hypothetical protein